MTKTMHLRVVTPDRIVIDRPVRSVQFMGIDGSYGILPNHAPLLTAMAPAGVVTIEDENGEKEDMFVSGGFAEMAHNALTLVCRAGERAEDIDPERAKAAEDRARAELEKMSRLSEDFVKAEAKLRKALIRERLVRKQMGTGTVTGR